MQETWKVARPRCVHKHVDRAAKLGPGDPLRFYGGPGISGVHGDELDTGTGRPFAAELARAEPALWVPPKHHDPSPTLRELGRRLETHAGGAAEDGDTALGHWLGAYGVGLAG
jgi:hypothetical protein